MKFGSLGTNIMTELIRIYVPMETAKQTAIWGTYGHDGKQHLEWVRFIDCSTSHLKAILKTQHISHDYRAIINSILEDRKA